MSDPHGHGHPGQREPRSHGETHHELRRVNLNTASKEELADLPGFDLGMIDDLKSGGAEL